MDPLSHAALGRTLVPFVWHDSNRRAMAIAAVLGALSPDIDVAFIPSGWDRYLRVHEVGTHTVVGTIACGLLTSAAVRAFARQQPWRQLALAAWLGAASHVLLDLMSSARLRPLWPILDSQVSIPLVAMADPWLAGLLLTGFGAVLLARQSVRQIAATTMVVCAAFLTLKGAGAIRALGSYESTVDGGPSARAHMLEARWASLSDWHVFDRTASHVRAWRSDAFTKRTQPLFEWPLPPETPLIAASRSLSTVRNFLRAHDLGFAVTIAREPREKWVLWSDVRYCWRIREGAAEADLTISAEGQKLACAMWFGGAFDLADNPLREMIKIGGFTQTREPSP